MLIRALNHAQRSALSLFCAVLPPPASSVIPNFAKARSPTSFSATTICKCSEFMNHMKHKYRYLFVPRLLIPLCSLGWGTARMPARLSTTALTGASRRTLISMMLQVSTPVPALGCSRTLPSAPSSEWWSCWHISVQWVVRVASDYISERFIKKRSIKQTNRVCKHDNQTKQKHSYRSFI